MSQRTLFDLRALTHAVPLITILLCGALTAPSHAQTQPYYQGKTIRIIVGFTAGGLSDQWARMFPRSMPKFIAGRPEIIVQNMPGASSVVAANFIYSVAKPDGLTVGIPNSSLYLTQLIGRAEVKFDVRKFEWIGTQEKWTQMLYFRADSPFKTIGDVIKVKEAPKCGASGFASSGYILPKIWKKPSARSSTSSSVTPAARKSTLPWKKAKSSAAVMTFPRTSAVNRLIPGTPSVTTAIWCRTRAAAIRDCPRRRQFGRS